MIPRAQSLILRLACALTLTVTAAHAANPPADVCAELVAWLDEAQKMTSAGAAKPEAAAPELKTAVERPAQQQEPARGGGQDQAQVSSGITAPVTPGGPGATGPQGQAQEQSRSGAANAPGDERAATRPLAAAQPPPPPPAAAAKAPPPSPKAVEMARASATGRDLKGCRAAVREMRLAGVALPAPLLALGALKEAGPAPTAPAPR